jgi:hypothetical protein
MTASASTSTRRKMVTVGLSSVSSPTESSSSRSDGATIRSVSSSPYSREFALFLRKQFVYVFHFLP